MKEIVFNPCWCDHEKRLLPIVQKYHGIEAARKHVQASVRKCTLAEKWQNGICAHLSLFHKQPENNPRKVIVETLKKAKIDSPQYTVIINSLALGFKHIFATIDTLDTIRGAEQWRTFSLADFRSWRDRLMGNLKDMHSKRDSVLFKICREILTILCDDVICHLPGDPKRTTRSKNKFDSLMLAAHGILARDLELLWQMTQEIKKK